MPDHMIASHNLVMDALGFYPVSWGETWNDTTTSVWPCEHITQSDYEITEILPSYTPICLRKVSAEPVYAPGTSPCLLTIVFHLLETLVCILLGQPDSSWPLKECYTFAATVLNSVILSFVLVRMSYSIHLLFSRTRYLVFDCTTALLAYPCLGFCSCRCQQYRCLSFSILHFCLRNCYNE